MRNENERKYFNQILGDKLNGKNPVAFWSTVEDSSCNVDQFKQADAKYYTYDQIYLIEDTVGNRFGFFMPAQEKLLVNHWYVPNINGAINTKDSFLFSLNGQRKQMC